MHIPGNIPQRRSTLRQRPRSLPRATAAFGVLATLAVVGSAPAARAETGPVTGTGPSGQTLSVSQATGLDPDGATVHVTGAGYDQAKGIYVALCQDLGPGRIPSPCLGGADMSGEAAASAWIVPPGDPNAGTLATAFGPGGTFAVDLDLKSAGDSLDCAVVACSVVTRVDHRAAGDRSQDVRIPVTFADDGGGQPGTETPPGTVVYVQSGRTTAVGKPLDLLLHPDSGRLYVGSDNLVDTGDVNESGLYTLDPATGQVAGWIQNSPGSTGTVRQQPAKRFAGPLAGDGVVYLVGLRGVAAAKHGDAAATGGWLTGATILQVEPGTAADTVFVVRGTTLEEVEVGATAVTVRRSVALPGAGPTTLDAAAHTLWVADSAAQRVRAVDTGTLAVGDGIALAADTGSVNFVQADPANGLLWVGRESVLEVYRTATGERAASFTSSADVPTAIAIDAAHRTAFVAWQDIGHDGTPGSDGIGSLNTYDTATLTAAVPPTAIPGAHRQSGSASIAVSADGTRVYVGDPAQATVRTFTRGVAPAVVGAPADRSARVGETVTFEAAGSGTPGPAISWETSADQGATWQAVPGAQGGTLTVTATAADDGRRYRAVLTNAAGFTRSSAAKLTVAVPAAPTVRVSRTTGLADGETVTVTGSGFDPAANRGVGVYLAFGPAQDEPWANAGSFGATLWVKPAPVSGTRQVELRPDGTFTAELALPAAYTGGTGAVDCRTAACGLFTFAAHGSTDRTYDTYTPVTFKTTGGPGDPGGPGEPKDQQVVVGVTGGPLTLSVAGDPIRMSDATLAGGSPQLTSNGALNNATVSDLRGSAAGWTLTGHVSDFTGAPGGTIPGTGLGWQPTASVAPGSLAQTTAPVVHPGAPILPGDGLATTRTLCAAPAGSSAGTFTCGGALDLAVPGNTAPGVYTATLTLTLS